MASYPEIEGWFSILSTGMAGLRLLRDYGIRTSELEYFICNFGQTKMKIAAFAPQPLCSQYESTFNDAESKLKGMMKNLADPNISDENISIILQEVQKMYDLLSIIYQATASGFIVA